MPTIKFTKEHEWVSVDGDIATVGITKHAAEQLGDVVFVEVPAIGRKVTAGEACAVVESVKAASDIYAPVSGTVTAVNDALSANPALLNTDPFGDGWIFKIGIEAGEDIEHLKSAAQYREQIGGADAGGEV